MRRWASRVFGQRTDVRLPHPLVARLAWNEHFGAARFPSRPPSFPYPLPVIPAPAVIPAFLSFRHSRHF